jgi:glycosyltransferase involved in cell wall biosynthesis
MIVLHTTPIKLGKISGVSASVLNLIKAQNARRDVDAALVARGAERDRVAEMGFPLFDRIRFRGHSGQLDLPAPFDRPDLVVFHSTYFPADARIAAKLSRAGIPYVFCPQGCITCDAQAHRKWKKKIANLLYFNRFVGDAAALHFVSPREAAMSSGWNRSVFVVSNGTQLPAASELASPGRSSPRRIVFIGRLALEHKGLDLLLDACALVRSQLRGRGVRVELYGPDHQGGQRALRRRIARLRLHELVALNGPVIGDAKASLLQQTDVFLHPSRYEGHPISLLEALAYGLPCLVTPGTNMAEEVTAAGAGWVVEPSPAGIAAGLEEVLQTDGPTLQEAGSNARQLALREYTWELAASRSLEAYRKWAA